MKRLRTLDPGCEHGGAWSALVKHRARCAGWGDYAAVVAQTPGRHNCVDARIIRAVALVTTTGIVAAVGLVLALFRAIMRMGHKSGRAEPTRPQKRRRNH